MKRNLVTIIAAIATMLTLAISANANENIKIMINGEEVISDVAPLTMPVYSEGKHIGDRVMVPIRAISEKLNFDVYWNQANKGINIYKSEKSAYTLATEIYSLTK